MMYHQTRSHQSQAGVVAGSHEGLVDDPGPFEIQPDHVRLDWPVQRSSQGTPDMTDPVGSSMRGRELSVLAVGHPSKRLVDGDSGRRGQDPGLSQPASDGLADPARSLDDRPAPDQHAPHRRPEPFGEAKTGAVEESGEGGELVPAGRRGFPQPCPVEMELDSLGPREVGDALHLRQRLDGTVQGVLQADDRRRRGMDVVSPHDVLLDLLQGRVSAVARLDPVHRRSAERCHPSGFPPSDVRSSIAEDRVGRWLAQQRSKPDLVGHGARHHEQGRLVLCPRRHVRFQVDGAAVVTEDVIPEGAVDHRRQHRCRRSRHHVTYISSVLALLSDLDRMRSIASPFPSSRLPRGSPGGVMIELARAYTG